MDLSELPGMHGGGYFLPAAAAAAAAAEGLEGARAAWHAAGLP